MVKLKNKFLFYLSDRTALHLNRKHSHFPKMYWKKKIWSIFVVHFKNQIKHEIIRTEIVIRHDVIFHIFRAPFSFILSNLQLHF